MDKVTGKELSATPWASDKTAYAEVPTPGLTGYYADKASVASKAVTQENLEETVTYNPLGKLVPKPEKPNDPNFPSTPEVKYPNDPNDPTKPVNRLCLMYQATNHTCQIQTIQRNQVNQ